MNNKKKLEIILLTIIDEIETLKILQDPFGEAENHLFYNEIRAEIKSLINKPNPQTPKS